MKIKMTASFVGPEYSVEAGEETDRFSEAEAIRFIEAGFAIPVAVPKIERAVDKSVKEKR